MTASSPNGVFYQQFLQQIDDNNPTGQIRIVTDNPSSHNSLSTCTWHRAREQPTQVLREAMDLEQAGTANPTTTTSICVQTLRNPALKAGG
ncbi:hypothetical protein [Streptomyces sp. NPDC002265]|uniref:hypothetical protein n=1 Tax=Streptomyces sp. NPDC002265 TaxID=3154415 RepID=UPI00331A91B3